MKFQSIEESYHIGSGVPSLDVPHVVSDLSDSRAQLHSVYSSVCSAASTLASAFSLTSISFPTSSTTSFDSIRNGTSTFSMEAEKKQSRKRRFESKRDYRDFDRRQQKIIKKCPEQRCADISEARGDIACAHQRPALEEYCVGSGNPFEYSHDRTDRSSIFNYKKAQMHHLSQYRVSQI